MLRSRFEISRSWTKFFYALPSPRGEGNQSWCRDIFVTSRSKRNSHKRLDPKQCTIWTNLGHKSLQSTLEGTALKSKFNLCFKIKTNLGLELWTVIDKICQRSHADPRGRESFRGNPLQKQDQYWNRHQQVVGTLLLRNRDNGLTLKYKNPRILIVFKCQNSLLDYFDTKNKLIEKKMQEFITTKSRMNAGKNVRRYRILVRWDDAAIRQYSALVNSSMDIRSGKRCRTEEKVSILRDFEFSSEIPVPSSNLRTFRKYNQSCIARRCGFTEYIYHFGNGKELRSTVNHGLIPGGVSPQNRQTSCVLHCCESDG